MSLERYLRMQIGEKLRIIVRHENKIIHDYMTNSFEAEYIDVFKNYTYEDSFTSPVNCMLTIELIDE